jgi:putative glutamine amidotransferase
MQPIIGITPTLNDKQWVLNRDLSDSIFKAGGMPYIIAYSQELTQLQLICQSLDGLLLTGGAEDVDPLLYGEEPRVGLGDLSPERDRAEIILAREMLRLNKPIFAICRGCQILNVAAGGSLYQDIYSQCDTIQHRQKAPRSHLTHSVQIVEGTLLHQITGSHKIMVNSFHHQAVKSLAPEFIESAMASDGIIEAYESTMHRYVLGVQWHPENCYVTDEYSRKLFHAFVGACRAVQSSIGDFTSCHIP